MTRSKHYKRISNNQRSKLIEMVEEEGLSIKKSAKLMSYHYSTAKNILRIYRQEHRVEKIPNKRKRVDIPQ